MRIDLTKSDLLYFKRFERCWMTEPSEAIASVVVCAFLDRKLLLIIQHKTLVSRDGSKSFCFFVLIRSGIMEHNVLQAASFRFCLNHVVFQKITSLRLGLSQTSLQGASNRRKDAWKRTERMVNESTSHNQCLTFADEALVTAMVYAQLHLLAPTFPPCPLLSS